MDCDREDEYGGLSPKGSKSSFHEDDPQMYCALNTSTLQQIESFDEKDLESSRTCLKETELSSTNDISGKEHSCLIPPVGTSRTLAFDLAVHIKEVPADLQKPFQDDLNPPDSDALPVCTQLPAKHLKDSHSPSYNARSTHRHRKISRSSSSISKSLQSLNDPAEDLCATLLLACLFCKFWDCALAVGDGCQFCMASICSSLCSKACCCDPSSLEDLIEFCPCCSCSDYVEACGCSCGNGTFDCSICDLCLQTTECLELGMELSQLMFH